MLEIERKFLVRSLDWGAVESSQRMEQGYVFTGPDRTMRVRRVGDRYVMTLKVGADGIGRHEFEWDATPAEGQFILDRLCIGQVVRKTRHVVWHDGKGWEIDLFEGANAGLVVAEIELANEDEVFARPDWLGPEVTGDGRFFNASLAHRPFKDWGVSYPALLAENDAAGR